MLENLLWQKTGRKVLRLMGIGAVSLLLPIITLGEEAKELKRDTPKRSYLESRLDNITGNVLLKEGTYSIDYDILIREGASLTVEPGTIIQFDDRDNQYLLDKGEPQCQVGGGIVCRGTLTAKGTEEKPIVFTHNPNRVFKIVTNEKGRPEAMFYEEETTRYWKNIAFFGDGASGSVLSHCRISYGGGRRCFPTSRLDNDNPNAQSQSSQGGGIYIGNASPTITNCTIENNTAGGNGGGVWFEYGSPIIINNLIMGNKTLYNLQEYPNSLNNGTMGSGVYCHFDRYDKTRQPVIMSNRFENNGPAGWGGGLAIGSHGVIYISDNSAEVIKFTEGNISSNIFTNNSATRSGSNIFLRY